MLIGVFWNDGGGNFIDDVSDVGDILLFEFDWFIDIDEGVNVWVEVGEIGE